MKDRKNSIAPGHLVYAVLIVCTGLLWCGGPVFGQIKSSATKTVPYTFPNGQVGKMTTTNTSYENGDERQEIRYLDARGKLNRSTLIIIKPAGEQSEVQEIYDQNEKMISRFNGEYDSSGKMRRIQSERYQNGLLSSGVIAEYDGSGGPPFIKRYNPATERYENAPVKQANTPPTLTKSPPPSKGGKAPSSATKSGQRAPDDEAIFQAWWQYFSNDTEGLQNLKLAIIDCDADLKAAVNKWLDAAKAAGEQNKKSVRARNAVRPARARAQLARDEAARAQPADKAAKERDAAKAEAEADAAQRTAKVEVQKEQEANKVLQGAERNVDPAVRKVVKEAAEKELEKPPQERAQDTGQNRKSPPCPPKGGNKASVRIDSCLVGTWRSESLVGNLGYSYKGGAGIILTIKPDGLETIDYNGMKPIERTSESETHLWRGVVDAYFTTSNGTATITKAGKTDLTTKATYHDGHTSENNTKSLGPAALGNNPPDRSYNCDGTTLKFKSVGFNSTFKREKK